MNITEQDWFKQAMDKYCPKCRKKMTRIDAIEAYGHVPHWSCECGYQEYLQWNVQCRAVAAAGKDKQ